MLLVVVESLVVVEVVDGMATGIEGGVPGLEVCCLEGETLLGCCPATVGSFDTLFRLSLKRNINKHKMFTNRSNVPKVMSL